MKEKPIFQTATWWVSTSSGIRLYASRLLGGNVLLLSSPPSTIDMILMILTYRVDVLSEDSAYKQFCFQSCMPVNCLGGMSCSFPLPHSGFKRNTKCFFFFCLFKLRVLRGPPSQFLCLQKFGQFGHHDSRWTILLFPFWGQSAFDLLHCNTLASNWSTSPHMARPSHTDCICLTFLLCVR